MAWLKWWRRPAAERRALLVLVVHAAIDLTVFSVARRVDARLRVARWWLQRAVRARPRHSQTTLDVVGWCARWHPLRPQCLERSLAQCARLQREGIKARVCIGVQRGDAGFASHAWVERDGEIADNAAFTPMAVIDPQAPAVMPAISRLPPR